MRVVLPAAAFLALLVSAGCGAGDPGAVGNGTGGIDTEPVPSMTTTPKPERTQLYEAYTTVLQQGEGMELPAHGPELCLGGVAESLPPQCSGVPIANWDWSAVEGEQSRSGTTWGAYRVVGTYADGVFSVVEVGPFDHEAAYAAEGSQRDFTTPCPEPQGGWVDVDPAKASEEHFGAGAARAQRLPTYVALWVRYVGDPSPEEMMEMEETGLPQKIMNVVVNDDAAGAEAAIRAVWGGPLCVIERAVRTEKELQAIRAEAEAYIEDELGLELTWSQEGDVGLAAEVGVSIDPGGRGQAALDARFGPDMVLLFPALRPVAE